MGYRSIISLMPKTPPVDADAQAFLTAAAITDPTISGAINTLVVQMKADNIWSKMKAVYPFVGGSASAHKFNLKDPRDLDAAFRIVFNGGWTHSNNGATPNGTNGYADTKLNPLFNLAQNSMNLSFYSRINANSFGSYDMGCCSNSSGSVNPTYLITRYHTNLGYIGIADENFATSTAISDSRGLTSGGTNGSSTQKIFKNGVLVKTGTSSQSGFANQNIFIGADNGGGSALRFSNKECAFASIGDGLTDTEAANLYTAVQTFQTTLGRSVGTQTVSDSDAQAFVTNAAIVDQVEATAVNNLVVGMKADGIWSKMKAIYPFVGGSASAHKFNLKDPRDLDAAFRIVFNGGWTHSNNGSTPNGVNGFADTFLTPSINLSINSAHFSKYNRNNDLVGNKIDGAITGSVFLQQNYSAGNAIIGEVAAINSYTQTDTRGLFTAIRTASNSSKVFKNSTQQGTTNTSTISSLPIFSIHLGRRNDGGSGSFFNSYECAFASIGDGLTDAEAANLYTRVQAFQTALSRQV